MKLFVPGLAALLCFSCLDSSNNTEPQTSSAQSLASSGTSNSSSSIQLTAIGTQPKIQLNMTVYDFRSNHPDFENYDGRRFYMTPSQPSRCGNGPSDAIVVSKQLLDWTASVMGMPVRYDLVGQTMQFGGFGPLNAQVKKFQHHTALDERRVWLEPVVVTQDMVNFHLDTTADGYVVPSRANLSCDNAHFEDWFHPVPGTNLENKVKIELSRMQAPGDGSTLYYFDSQESPLGGFFPLDSLANKPGATFGKQNLKLWCPPPDRRRFFGDLELTAEELAGGNGSVVPSYSFCDSYWDAYDSTTGESSVVLGHNLARNYNFTTHIHLDFEQQDSIQVYFISGDDLWVFLDGKLALDHGGTHNATEVVLELDRAIDDSTTWKPKTMHTLDIFKAERQADDSQFRFYLRGLKNVALN